MNNDTTTRKINSGIFFKANKIVNESNYHNFSIN